MLKKTWARINTIHKKFIQTQHTIHLSLPISRSHRPISLPLTLRPDFRHASSGDIATPFPTPTPCLSPLLTLLKLRRIREAIVAAPPSVFFFVFSDECLVLGAICHRPPLHLDSFFFLSISEIEKKKKGHQHSGRASFFSSLFSGGWLPSLHFLTFAAIAAVLSHSNLRHPWNLEFGEPQSPNLTVLLPYILGHELSSPSLKVWLQIIWDE